MKLSLKKDWLIDAGCAAGIPVVAAALVWFGSLQFAMPMNCPDYPSANGLVLKNAFEKAGTGQALACSAEDFAIDMSNVPSQFIARFK